jgi:hypothetical protein
MEESSSAPVGISTSTSRPSSLIQAPSATSAALAITAGGSVALNAGDSNLIVQLCAE